MTTVLRAGSATDVGRVRTVNQDSKLITDRIYAVADGMGGHQGGEVASAIAIEILQESVIEPTVDSLLEAAHAANEAVLDKASQSPDLRGMGTTLCAITLIEAEDDQDDEIGWVNVGDSRIYLFRDGTLLQLTTDHSLVEDLRRDGQLSVEEAAVHPQRNILTRALGIDPDVVIDSRTVIPYRGDRFLICSDGLFNEVTEDLMAATLRQLDDPDDAAGELVRLANEHGGRDNITCVIVDVIDDGGRSVVASEAVAATASSDDPTTVLPATAANADSDDVAGFATPAAPSQHDDELWGKAVQDESEDHLTGDLHRGRVKHVTWRVLLFLFVLLVIAGAAVGAIGYSARNTYFVGYQGDKVVIYKGKPGGVLWFDPTVDDANTKLTKDQVPQKYQDVVAKGKEEPTSAKARAFVQTMIDEQKKAQSSGSATTTAPTTFSVGNPPPTDPPTTTELPFPPP